MWTLPALAMVLPSTGPRMKAASILALIGCLATVTEPKIYPRCKLAKILLRAGMDNFQGFSLENWSCMAYYESRYNTTAQKVLKDGSIDYGIFQINSYMWCRRAELEEMNYCRVACSALLTDDLTDAIICAKKIAHETEGMNYWQGWKKHCEGRDLSKWKRGCEVP
ncbi:lysozyme-like protein 1 [Artibeus jamaicensis]|uniref:lysozyme-like protein 1 n=1 Tax=Artibeus jamaicensis TaxID=9417 RepID=UPI00235AE608|nr:lysozyme-like protein 1 [Artibeus jamaicensis]